MRNQKTPAAPVATFPREKKVEMRKEKDTLDSMYDTEEGMGWAIIGEWTVEGRILNVNLEFFGRWGCC